METEPNKGDFSTKIASLKRQSKRRIAVMTDVISLIVILWAAFVMRLSDLWPETWLFANWELFLFTPLVAIIIFLKLGMYRVVMRAIGPRFFGLAALAVSFMIFALYLFMLLFDLMSLTTIPIIFGLTFFVYLGGSRLAARYFFIRLTNKVGSKENVLIYGAGAAGFRLAQLLDQSQAINVEGFIDDDKILQGATVFGLRVFSRERLEDLIRETNIASILLAMPQLSPEERRGIVQGLQGLGVIVRTIPPISEIISGARIESLKDIGLDDLLGRKPIAPDVKLVSKSVLKKSICITGAGGSIGSEIARQCLSFGARRLILFEMSEHALYTIEQELRDLISAESFNCELVSVLGSVTDKKRIDLVFRKFEVNVVYHAAAYKHVPLVEANPFKGIYNNTFGTKIAAEAAKANSVDRFILISTDKAVRPTNIMGASKRLAELVLQDLARQKSPTTIFSIVRFGNVLGSSGSVVPLFEKQIKRGRAVTVTHPEVTRFFMSLSEATSLVIQAGSMARGGEVFLLDMGDSVRIFDLAKLMISLSGLSLKSEDNPNGDIEVRFTGLRPGEKLHEELLIDGISVSTNHPKILASTEANLYSEDLADLLLSLEEAIQKMDLKKLIILLKASVVGYKPSRLLTEAGS